MCGRYTYLTSWEELSTIIPLVLSGEDSKKRYNIAPTQTAPIIRLDEEGKFQLQQLRWGLIPSWNKDQKIGTGFINARCESVAEKPSFRSAFKSRRCVVPMSGFYEWKELEDGKKQPYFIFEKDKAPLFAAGIWETWNSVDKGPIESYAILTTDADGIIEPLHDRKPVFIDARDIPIWTAKEFDPMKLKELCSSYETKRLDSYKVSTKVNSVKNIGEECIVEMQ